MVFFQVWGKPKLRAPACSYSRHLGLQGKWKAKLKASGREIALSFCCALQIARFVLCLIWKSSSAVFSLSAPLEEGSHRVVPEASLLSTWKEEHLERDSLTRRNTYMHAYKYVEQTYLGNNGCCMELLRVKELIEGEVITAFHKQGKWGKKPGKDQ